MFAEHVDEYSTQSVFILGPPFRGGHFLARKYVPQITFRDQPKQIFPAGPENIIALRLISEKTIPLIRTQPSWILFGGGL